MLRSARVPLRPPIPEDEPWWASRRSASLKRRTRARASERRLRALRCHEGSAVIPGAPGRRFPGAPGRESADRGRLGFQARDTKDPVAETP